MIALGECGRNYVRITINLVLSGHNKVTHPPIYHESVDSIEQTSTYNIWFILYLFKR